MNIIDILRESERLVGRQAVSLRLLTERPFVQGYIEGLGKRMSRMIAVRDLVKVWGGKIYDSYTHNEEQPEPVSEQTWCHNYDMWHSTRERFQRVSLTSNSEPRHKKTVVQGHGTLVWQIFRETFPSAMIPLVHYLRNSRSIFGRSLTSLGFFAVYYRTRQQPTFRLEAIWGPIVFKTYTTSEKNAIRRVRMTWEDL